MNHTTFIHRCLELAEKGRGHVGVNPMVGALVVCDGEIIAEAWHKKFGDAHAEQQVVQKVDQEMCSRSTLYVNLEPCCHQGKTPPCTDLILQKKVKRVVYGMRDPNPDVAGKGIAALADAGVEVIGPILPVECRRLNRGFVSLHEQGRPWITIKRAQTREGRIGNDDGSPLKITSQQQDTWAHTFLRARHDAILVGVQTVITDNPALTVRRTSDRSMKSEGLNKKLDQNKKVVQDSPQPYRIILDPHSRIPFAAKVLSDQNELRTIVITSKDVLVKDTEFVLDALLRFLVAKGITSVLIEGGPKTWDVFTKAKLIDEEVVLIGS